MTTQTKHNLKVKEAHGLFQAGATPIRIQDGERGGSEELAAGVLRVRRGKATMRQRSYTLEDKSVSPNVTLPLFVEQRR